jgi:ABC-2 type transport system permease protein
MHTKVLGKLAWVEIKLFLREPLTVVFTLGLPLITLFVLGGVFGNTPDPQGVVYRGKGPMDFYVPAYVGLVTASIGLIGLPVHLAEYRERGVLRRLRASGMPVWTVLGAQGIVALALATVGSLLLGLAAALAYRVHGPVQLAGVVGAFLLAVLTFSAIGVMLGALLPTARAAQGAGVLLWFVMLFLGGAGPPPEVLTRGMRVVADITPLKHVVVLLQDPWLGFGWNLTQTLVVLGFALAAALLSLRFFRWE